jgi:4-hydroxy-4-methyl-2-oxoglutarate aldolase
VPTSAIAPRHKAEATIIGHAVTIRYLPERGHLLHPGHAESVPRLAHHVVFRLAKPGDVMVVDAVGCGEISVMGGLAAEGAMRAHLSGVVVDGAVRDVDEIRFSQLPVWSRYVTPITGKARLEAIAINSPIQCGGVQVQPGDLVMADASGICFVPNGMIVEVATMVEQIAREESVGRRVLRSARNRSTANHPPA